MRCPSCGSDWIVEKDEDIDLYKCLDCGEWWFFDELMGGDE